MDPAIQYTESEKTVGDVLRERFTQALSQYFKEKKRVKNKKRINALVENLVDHACSATGVHADEEW